MSRRGQGVLIHGRSTPGGISASLSTAAAPVRDYLRVSEIHYNPADPGPGELELDNNEFEFIEVTNIGPDPLDLTAVHFVYVEAADRLAEFLLSYVEGCDPHCPASCRNRGRFPSATPGRSPAAPGLLGIASELLTRRRAAS